MFKFNKKGDSLVVSYVLLISITLIIAGLAYTWLRFQADISEPESCPDGVSIYIEDYSFNNPLTELNLTLLNNGRFNITGFFIRINNESDKEEGVFNFFKGNYTIIPGENLSLYFNQTNYFVNVSTYNKICFIEVQPFVKSSKNEIALCSQMSTKKIVC